MTVALCLGFAAISAYAGNCELSDLEADLAGDWVAAETFIQQPPSNLLQSIKTLSFSTNHLVSWTDTNTNSCRPQTGVFGVWIPGTNSQVRHLPSIVVAPTNYADPFQCGIALLTLNNVQVAYDSRFNQELYGKLLKALDGNGHPVLFIRRQMRRTANHTSDCIRQPADGSPKPSR